MEKELANWIFWEENGEYYCFDCIETRRIEISKNKEFPEDIDHENGEECGYYQDYASEDYDICCCKCSQELFSNIDC